MFQTGDQITYEYTDGRIYNGYFEQMGRNNSIEMTVIWYDGSMTHHVVVSAAYCVAGWY